MSKETPDTMKAKAEAFGNWMKARERYHKISCTFEESLKHLSERGGPHTPVAYVAAMVVDNISRNRGFVSIHKSENGFVIRGFHLNPEAQESLIRGVSLQFASIPSEEILQIVNSARSWLGSSLSGLSIPCLGWMLGNIKIHSKEEWITDDGVAFNHTNNQFGIIDKNNGGIYLVDNKNVYPGERP